MHPYQPIDFVLCLVVLALFVVAYIATRGMSERELRNRLFTPEEEARFFHLGEKEVRDERNGL